MFTVEKKALKARLDILSLALPRALWCCLCCTHVIFNRVEPPLKGRLNTDTSPQNFWTTFLPNDLMEKFKKSAVASAIAIPLPLCFSWFVPLRRFRENLTKPFYFYLSRTCDSPGGTPSVISVALNSQMFEILSLIYEGGLKSFRPQHEDGSTRQWKLVNVVVHLLTVTH